MFSYINNYRYQTRFSLWLASKWFFLKLIGFDISFVTQDQSWCWHWFQDYWIKSKKSWANGQLFVLHCTCLMMFTSLTIFINHKILVNIHLFQPSLWARQVPVCPALVYDLQACYHWTWEDRDQGALVRQAVGSQQCSPIITNFRKHGTLGASSLFKLGGK